MNNIPETHKNPTANLKKNILAAAVLILLGIYLCMFAYLNLARYSQHVDSDIAAEAILAKEIWTEKTLTPDDWIGSTERRILGTSAVASVFYGLTGSMTMAAGIACVIIGAAFAGIFYLFMRKTGLSRIASVTALLAICALPVNGLRNEGQIVPFVHLLLFLFADYYAMHVILMFLSILFYLHLKYNKEKCSKAINIKEAVVWICLFLFSTAMSMGGQRCLQMVILPMTVVELVCLFVESDFISKRISGRRYIATAFVGSLLLSGLLGGLKKGQIQYAVYLNSAKDIMERIFITVPASILEGFGIAGNAKAGSFESLMQMLVWAFLVLVGFGIFYIFIIEPKQSKISVENAAEEKKTKSNIQKHIQRETIAILLTSFGITAFIIAFTTAEAAHNYFVFAWFAALAVMGVLIDRMYEKKSLLGDIIILAVCVFAVLNIKYTYVDALTVDDNLKEYEEVADFMIDSGIEYGYAEFWDAGRIALVRDGAVTMGCSYSMDNLGMYWWLTSTKWYPPTLPEDMTTAYVVRQEKKDSFLRQFDVEVNMNLAYENEKFAVYVSDRNYVGY